VLKQLLYPSIKCYMNPVGRTKSRRHPARRGPEGALRWYLLIHQLPPEPLYLRAKIRQRLSRVGAVALKNAVYVLPRLEECLEDFQWIGEAAVAGGGEAYVCEAEFLGGKTEQALVDRFRAERDADYAALVEEIRGWKREKDKDLPLRAARARKRLEEIRKIDFFDAPRRKEAEKRVADLDAASRRPRRRTGPGRSSLLGRIWVTRRNIHIDRIASAWLIRRFVDPRARFRFVDPKEPARKGEVRFDMAGGDFSHEGDRCTFETFVARTGLTDRALTEVGEIVHDIDLKDDKFGRSEAPGIERLITGLALANPRDEARLERGLILFDELYQSFRRRTPVLMEEGSK
jgi:hypothetical protein